jgi:hypothetical protein
MALSRVYVALQHASVRDAVNTKKALYSVIAALEEEGEYT